MNRSLWIASTGMQAQQLQLDTIANNLANVTTIGFKKSRPEFQDLLYRTLKAAGAASSAVTEVASGIQVGHGTKPVAIQKLFSQGDFKETQQPLDLVIEGDGFFQVLLPTGEVAYTRAGSFLKDSEGEMVTADGYSMEPAITIPPEALSITVGEDGIVSVTLPGETESSQVGQIELASFVNPAGLEAMGHSLFRPSTASGPANTGTAGTDQYGRILQGFVEMSNVSIVEEMVNMIIAQRAYETNSKAIKASDEMLQLLNNLVT